MRTFPLILVLFSALLTGCATFSTERCLYGVGMNSVYDAKDLELFLSEQGDAKYNPNHRTMNTDIYAWANIDYGFLCLGITVYNDTKSPIATNYFTDSFSLITTDGRTFHLEKRSITSYPNVEYINPGCNARYLLNSPYGSNSERLRNETAMIVCELGTLHDRAIIILKPLPEK